jgi:peptidoglycan LD-endopeptidase LytH
VKIFKVLAGGWIGGGALIVLLSAMTGIGIPGAFGGPSSNVVASGIVVPSTTASVSAPAGGGSRWEAGSGGPSNPIGTFKSPSFAKHEGTDRPYAPGAIILPVVGIDGSSLRDTFHEARGGGRVHRAIDILAPRGTPVVAAVTGPIRKIFESRAGGLTIYQFDQKGERVYYYAHLDRYAAGMTEGLNLEQGTILGYVGTSGNAPPGTPHLHFSIEDLPPTKEYWKGSPVNPYPILAAAAR